MEESTFEVLPASDTCPTEETALADPELSLESVITQTGGDEKILNVVLDSTPAQPIIFKEICGKSIKQAKIYMGMKKKRNGSQILFQEIWPVHKLWVLNTRFKLVRQRHKPRWRGFYLITKFHSHRRPNMKDLTTHLKRIIDKHLNPYLLSPYDATKE
ncbi:unnamed protein product [Malus baccata var. baccata]